MTVFYCRYIKFKLSYAVFQLKFRKNNLGWKHKFKFDSKVLTAVWAILFGSNFCKISCQNVKTVNL